MGGDIIEAFWEAVPGIRGIRDKGWICFREEHAGWMEVYQGETMKD